MPSSANMLLPGQQDEVGPEQFNPKSPPIQGGSLPLWLLPWITSSLFLPTFCFQPVFYLLTLLQHPNKMFHLSSPNSSPPTTAPFVLLTSPVRPFRCCGESLAKRGLQSFHLGPVLSISPVSSLSAALMLCCSLRLLLAYFNTNSPGSGTDHCHPESILCLSRAHSSVSHLCPFLSANPPRKSQF